MMKKYVLKPLILVIFSVSLVACDGKVEACKNAGGGFDYELKECRCYKDNTSKQCDIFVDRPVEKSIDSESSSGAAE